MATMESINAKANAGLATGIVGTSLGAIATGVLNGNGNGLLGGIFGGNLHCFGKVDFIPVETVLDGENDKRLKGNDLDSNVPTEN